MPGPHGYWLRSSVATMLGTRVWLLLLGLFRDLLIIYSVDKTGERFFHVSGWWWGVILGFIIAFSTMSIGGRYVSMFLMACGYAG